MITHRIAIRTDASSQIGTGHFMRCLTVADEMQKREAQVRFVCRHLPDYLANKLSAQGHEFISLTSAPDDTCLDELRHSDWLGVSQSQDATDTIQALADNPWDWLIVDHYALDFRWETMLEEKVNRLLVIDDIADRHHYCDLLLDQNLYTDMQVRYSGKLSPHCQMLLGPSYALLRNEFYQLHSQVELRSGSVRHILIFFGGVDVDNYTGCAIEVLATIDIPGLVVDVVIGKQHPCCDQIRLACMRYKFNFHVQTEKMAELMASADFAIGASGSATWERCCLGLPALLLATADNQINIARALDEFGACAYVGELKPTSDAKMKNEILRLINSPDLLRSFSEKSYSLVDGLGVTRVCQMLGC